MDPSISCPTTRCRPRSRVLGATNNRRSPRKNPRFLCIPICNAATVSSESGLGPLGMPTGRIVFFGGALRRARCCSARAAEASASWLRSSSKVLSRRQQHDELKRS